MSLSSDGFEVLPWKYPERDDKNQTKSVRIEDFWHFMPTLNGTNLRYWGGVIVTKTPFEAARAWHQDWWAWQFDCSQAEKPPQIAIFWYPQETTRQNGCLRVVPGSHRKHCHVHDLYDHEKQTFSGQTCGEIDVPAGPNDLILIDARLMHATHPNNSSQTRLCFVFWYHPDFDNLDPALKCHIEGAGYPVEVDFKPRFT